METVNLSRRRVLDLAPFSIGLLLFGLTLNHPLEASLFDPERGHRAAEAITNSGSSLYELRLDGILTLGDHHRVLISGPEGETYRFNWRGVIDKPMAFTGESADRVVGYRLSSADTRSVWLQLPLAISCEPDPEKGVAACEEGRVKLALVRRSFPQTAAENRRGSGVQQKMSPTLAPRPQQEKRTLLTKRTQNRGLERKIGGTQIQKEQPVVINSSSPGYYGGYAGPSAPAAPATPAATPATVEASGNSVPQDSASLEPQTPPPPPKTEADYPYLLNPERADMQAEQQQLIDSAPPNYWGVE